jgi:hypothetical protein
MFVCCKCCVVRSVSVCLCDKPIPSPEESYKPQKEEEAMAHVGLLRQKINKHTPWRHVIGGIAPPILNFKRTSVANFPVRPLHSH